jgi:hypothetical protein
LIPPVFAQKLGPNAKRAQVHSPLTIAILVETIDALDP